MRTSIFSSAIALLLCIPIFVHGNVVINEIAWMGTNVSATDEWIELFNDGAEDTSLSGWKILADDGSPSMSLSGSIPANGYYLLERTDDESVPGIPANKIYSGDLGNAGETLRLLDGVGGTVDTVVGGTGWQSVGGDNTTKDTPQRQPDGTWLTGIPTPKALNTTVSSLSSGEGGEVAGTSTTKTSTPRKRVVTGGYKQVVFGYAGEDVSGVVGASVRFEGYAVSDKNIPLSAAMYQWSFGDGGHAKGREAAHTYEEPGTYIAVLRVFGKYQKWQDKITVTILPVDAYIQAKRSGEGGYIEVRNGMDTELDLSGWKLAVLYARGNLRDRAFIMPEGTLIAPASSVRFSSLITRLVFSDEDTMVLQYPSGARLPEREGDEAPLLGT